MCGSRIVYIEVTEFSHKKYRAGNPRPAVHASPVMKHHALVNITSPLSPIDLVCYSGVNL